MIYYLSRDYKSNRINDAGSKARLDVEQVMDQLGFSPQGNAIASLKIGCSILCVRSP